MPYIAADQRPRLDAVVEVAAGSLPHDVGELNYLLTRIVDCWLADAERLRYERLNAAIGVLECVKLELYRRVAAPYEDGKCVDNGDVYTAG